MSWSIGIFEGPSPLDLRPAPGCSNPVLDASRVGDLSAGFVADPFMLAAGGAWHLFFEVLDRESGLGRIALAQSEDARRWRYRGVVLREPFHLSYPLVFRWRGQHYMLPETLDAGEVRLYRADRFPTHWSRNRALVPGRHADPTLFRHGGRWWLFTCPAPDTHDCLALFAAEAPTGPWREHPASPVVEGDAVLARPAGRPVLWEGVMLRFAQDCAQRYGRRVHAVEIETLTESRYRERPRPESPILSPTGRGWNAAGMHHLDAHRLERNRWIACVDGR